MLDLLNKKEKINVTGLNFVYTHKFSFKMEYKSHDVG